MGEHDSLGEACCTRCVLHVADIVLCDETSAEFNFLLRNGVRKADRLIPCVATVLLGTCDNDVTQERKLLAVKRARLAFVKFGAEFFHDLYIVNVLVVLDHDKCLGVGLTEQILDLVHSVRRVDGDKYGADLCGCPEG